MKVVVVGAGAVGSRVARQLLSAGGLTELVLIDQDLTVAEEAALSLGGPASATTIGAIRLESRIDRFREVMAGASAAVLATADEHEHYARAALNDGVHVVSVSDDVETVKELQALASLAERQNRSLVIGAGMSPGLACLLALHGSQWLEVVDEIHVAKFGTGGPACARQHHKALRNDSLNWRNQQWEGARGSSGRDLVYFPDPVGGLDCYQAALAEPQLLLPAFPGVVRASSRVAATRRDRSTKWLPMLRRPHPEGLIGAVRVELRGWAGSVRNTVILGALDRPAVAAACVAAVSTRWAIHGSYKRTGAGGLAELVENSSVFLNELSALGVKAAVFEGALANDA